MTACKQHETVDKWLEDEEELEEEDEEVVNCVELEEVAEEDGTIEADVEDVDEEELQLVINEWFVDSWIGDNLRLKSYGDWCEDWWDWWQP